MLIEADPRRIRNAWRGRISGCEPGKPVERLSMRQDLEGLASYLRAVSQQRSG
jgi:hypothetical protein